MASEQIKEGALLRLKSGTEGWIKGQVVEYFDVLPVVGGYMYGGGMTPGYKVHILEGKHKGETIQVPENYVEPIGQAKPGGVPLYPHVPKGRQPLFPHVPGGRQPGAKLPATEKPYQRGKDGYPIGADKIMRDAWGPIPNPDQPFWSGKGFIKPVKIHGWQWSPDYHSWRAYVRFPDGTETWTSPRKQSAEKLPQTLPQTGTCYADAWRFLIKEEEGELIHGTLFSGGRRTGHAWVETLTGWVWEPETGKFFTDVGFKGAFAPVIESRYTAEEAAIMMARTKHFGPWSEQERLQYLGGRRLELLASTEGDPIRKYCCRQCGECAPKELLEEGKFLDRISWLRSHYQTKHPGMWGKRLPLTVIEDFEPVSPQYRHLVGLVSEPLPKEAD